MLKNGLITSRLSSWRRSRPPGNGQPECGRVRQRTRQRRGRRRRPGLNLSPEQTERIDALRAAHRRDIRPLQNAHGKGKQLRELWLAKTPSKERILSLQREVHDLRGQLLEKLATYRLEVLRMLTPDQQAKVQTFEAERHRGERASGMGRGPFPDWREEGHPPMGNPAEKSVRIPRRRRAMRACRRGEPIGPANR